MWIFLAVLSVLALIGISFYKHTFNAKTKAVVERAQRDNEDVDRIQRYEEGRIFPIPGWAKTAAIVATLVFTVMGTFHQIFFYAQPGYVYHVRTILGEERVVDSVGYSYYLFGYINEWKKAMSVQAVSTSGGDDIDAESERSRSGVSASLPLQQLVFLDRVTADASATVRYLIPTDRESFLKMVYIYRSPENLLRTALIPAFRETLQASASLMSAEEYYSGKRTDFNIEFVNQMRDGVYVVERKEVLVDDLSSNRKAEANASAGKDQDEFDDGKKVVFQVIKKLDDNGQPIRKIQDFTAYGIAVAESRVTDMIPNIEFQKRMADQQQASADRAIARESRIKEEEQTLLAVAEGNRKIAQKQAQAKVAQIKQTTDAETAKQLVLTKARELEEQAEILERQSKILLRKAEIDAKAVKVTADAQAYKKEAIIKADNALAQKLETEVAIQRVWAEAFSKRKVPQYVFGGGAGGTPTGQNGEASTFMKLMTMEAAKRLNYDRSLDPAK